MLYGYFFNVDIFLWIIDFRRNVCRIVISVLDIDIGVRVIIISFCDL